MFFCLFVCFFVCECVHATGRCPPPPIHPHTKKSSGSGFFFALNPVLTIPSYVVGCTNQHRSVHKVRVLCTATNRWYRSCLQDQSCCQSSVILAQIGKTVQFKMACAHQQTFANSFRNITIKYEFNPFHSCLF